MKLLQELEHFFDEEEITSDTPDAEAEAERTVGEWIAARGFSEKELMTAMHAISAEVTMQVVRPTYASFQIWI